MRGPLAIVVAGVVVGASALTGVAVAVSHIGGNRARRQLPER
jgi:hypothetical protein